MRFIVSTKAMLEVLKKVEGKTTVELFGELLLFDYRRREDLLLSRARAIIKDQKKSIKLTKAELRTLRKMSLSIIKNRIGYLSVKIFDLRKQFRSQVQTFFKNMDDTHNDALLSIEKFLKEYNPFKYLNPCIIKI